MKVRDDSRLGALDAVETAACIRHGELSAVEVVAAAIERAQALEPALNAIPTEAYADARRQAERPRPGPLSGVPTFVKALDDVAGQVNDLGSRGLRERVARRTAPYVAHLLDTGLISLGRSAAPEIGLNATTEPLAHGPTRNPWNPDYGAGGSSGGAAALVAARVVPLAQGSDAGGSIRIPSSACGLVGLKPSRARGFEPQGANLLPVRIATYGALTRSVRDSAHFIAALEARSRPVAAPPIGLVQEPAAARLRIGVYTGSPLGEPVDPEVREVTLAAARRCADLGHALSEIDCPYDAGVIEDFWIYVGFMAALAGAALRRARADFEPWTLGLAAHFRARWRRFPGVVRRLRGVERVSQRLFAEHDLLLCPTLSTPPPRIGEFAPDRPFDEVFALEQRHMCFTPIQNASGEPAISLPLGRSAAGLPIGVQLAGPACSEARLLALAYELEASGAFATGD